MCCFAIHPSYSKIHKTTLALPLNKNHSSHELCLGSEDNTFFLVPLCRHIN